MTPEMSFECLLVSKDPSVVCPLNRVLDALSISTKLCLTPTKALNELQCGSADLVVIDWLEDGSGFDLLKDIQRSDLGQKKTIVVVSTLVWPVPGTHMVLTKPVTAESGAKGLKLIYARMLRDHRQHARYALMTPVLAKDSANRTLEVTITNIGSGGIGLLTKETLKQDDVLSCHLSLPNARRPIYMEARVLWARQYGICGCEFVRIPPTDRDILDDWLKAKCKVKKPLIVV